MQKSFHRRQFQGKGNEMTQPMSSVCNKRKKTITVPPLNPKNGFQQRRYILSEYLSDSLLKSLTTLVNDTDKAIAGDSRNRYIHTYM